MTEYQQSRWEEEWADQLLSYPDIQADVELFIDQNRQLERALKEVESPTSVLIDIFQRTVTKIHQDPLRRSDAIGGPSEASGLKVVRVDYRVSHDVGLHLAYSRYRAGERLIIFKSGYIPDTLERTTSLDRFDIVDDGYFEHSRPDIHSLGLVAKKVSSFNPNSLYFLDEVRFSLFDLWDKLHPYLAGRPAYEVPNFKH